MKGNVYIKCKKELRNPHHGLYKLNFKKSHASKCKPFFLLISMLYIKN